MAILLLGLLGVVLLIVAGAAVLLATVDLRPVIERYASAALGRRLTIGALRIGWGDPLSLELGDLRLANASWGSTAEMIQLDRLSAELDPWSILRGAPQFQHLKLARPVIVLERDAEGTGNWRFGSHGLSAPGPVAIIPKNRLEFPTLIDFALEDGVATYRTSSGTVLRIDLNALAIRSGGSDQKVSLTLDGAYQGVTAHLDAEGQSFEDLRAASVPYGLKFSLASPAAAIGFDGTLAHPLDFDGAQGRLDLDAGDLGELLKVFNAELRADYPLTISGTLARTGDHWQVSNAAGRIAASAFTGTLALTEGTRGATDDALIAADFPKLDLNPLLADHRDQGSLALRPEEQRGTAITARITAQQADYGTLRIADAALEGRLAPGEITVDKLSLAFAGGTVSVAGSIRAEAAGGHLAANAALTGADAGQLAHWMGAAPGEIAGTLDGAAVLEATGETLRDAWKTNRGAGVLAMARGHVARDLLEKVTTDLRTLFLKGEGAAQITCLLGIVNLENGLGAIAPLRLRTPDTTLVAGGEVDLVRDRLDLVIKTETASTNLFALNLPLRVTGALRAPTVRPTFGANPPSGGTLALPDELRQLAERNPCR